VERTRAELDSNQLELARRKRELAHAFMLVTSATLCATPPKGDAAAGGWIGAAGGLIGCERP
jgi:hypothetical protein